MARSLQEWKIDCRVSCSGEATVRQILQVTTNLSDEQQPHMYKHHVASMHQFLAEIYEFYSASPQHCHKYNVNAQVCCLIYEPRRFLEWCPANVALLPFVTAQPGFTQTHEAQCSQRCPTPSQSPGSALTGRCRRSPHSAVRRQGSFQSASA
jgi:hypothetical protein